MRARLLRILQAADRAALRWLLSFRAGERARLCGAYGLGLASCAVALGAHPPSEGASVALSWLGIAACLYLAGLDRVDSGVPGPPRPGDLPLGSGKDPDDEPTAVFKQPTR